MLKSVGFLNNNKGIFDSLFLLVKELKSVLEKEKTNCACIFSPGCTSFGMFENEFDRGRKFKKQILETFS